jgi:hypothetical protein
MNAMRALAPRGCRASRAGSVGRARSARRVGGAFLAGFAFPVVLGFLAVSSSASCGGDAFQEGGGAAGAGAAGSGGKGGKSGKAGSAGATSGGGAAGAGTAGGAGAPACDQTKLQTDPRHCGACGHDCEKGACEAGRCAPYMIAAAARPEGLFVDGSGVYWTSALPAGSGGVFRADLVGDAQVPLATAEDMPRHVAVIESGAYWSNSGDGQIRHAPSDGSAPPDTFDASGGSPLGLSASGTVVAWANASSGQILIRNVGDAAATPLPTAEVAPQYVMLDGATIFWTTCGASCTPGSTGQLRKSSNVLVTLIEKSAPGMITQDATSLYFTDHTPQGSVISLDKNGGAPVVLASQQPGPIGVAVDATHAYWTCEGDGSVRRRPLAGGETETIASGQQKPWTLVGTDVALYWVNASDDGAVMKWVK